MNRTRVGVSIVTLFAVFLSMLGAGCGAPYPLPAPDGEAAPQDKVTASNRQPVGAGFNNVWEEMCFTCGWNIAESWDANRDCFDRKAALYLKICMEACAEAGAGYRGFLNALGAQAQDCLNRIQQRRQQGQPDTCVSTEGTAFSSSDSCATASMSCEGDIVAAEAAVGTCAETPDAGVDAGVE